MFIHKQKWKNPRYSKLSRKVYTMHRPPSIMLKLVNLLMPLASIVTAAPRDRLIRIHGMSQPCRLLAVCIGYRHIDLCMKCVDELSGIVDVSDNYPEYMTITDSFGLPDGDMQGAK